METQLYRPASLETAACLWEAVMDMRSTHPDMAAAFERMGTSHLRLTVIGWTDAADADWATVKEECWDKPFDWEWIPEWLAENVIWTDNTPTLQTPRTIPGGLR